MADSVIILTRHVSVVRSSSVAADDDRTTEIVSVRIISEYRLCCTEHLSSGFVLCAQHNGEY